MRQRLSLVVGFSLVVAGCDHSAEYETGGVRYRLSLPAGARLTQDVDVVKEWEADGLVWCLVGTIDQKRLYGIAEHLGGESSPAPTG